MNAPPVGQTGPMSDLRLLHSGKVRDVYAHPADGTTDLLLVASDRVSVYDVVLPTPIPDKGRILTQLSLWWFEQLADLVPNHVVSATDVPPELAGRAIRVRRLEMVPVECIARGYLAGLGLREYEKGRAISGVPLPPGLVEGSRLPEPVFTPTTKAAPGEGHDEFVTFGDVAADGPEPYAVGAQTAERLRELTLAVYRRGARVAAKRDVIVADTKLEFGRDAAGELVLGDEVLTPDSSRFWPVTGWRPGRPQPSLDKQFIRDWSAATGWDRRPPAPEVPDEIVAATRDRYVDVYQRITGSTWS